MVIIIVLPFGDNQVWPFYVPSKHLHVSGHLVCTQLSIPQYRSIHSLSFVRQYLHTLHFPITRELILPPAHRQTAAGYWTTTHHYHRIPAVSGTETYRDTEIVSLICDEDGMEAQAYPHCLRSMIYFTSFMLSLVAYEARMYLASTSHECGIRVLDRLEMIGMPN